jgi:predicted MFS family arabinose efflux permease
MKAKNNQYILAWIILSIFYAYQYVIRNLPAITSQMVIDNLSLNPDGFGLFCGIYYIGYTAATLPFSLLIDKYDPRKIIVITVLLTISGLIAFSTQNFYLALIGRLLNGLGSVGAVLGLFKILSYNPQESGKRLGLSVTFGLMGAIYGGKPLAMIIDFWGFNKIQIIFVILGLLIALTLFIVIPKTTKEVSNRTLLKETKEIFANKKLLLLALAGGLLIGPMEGFADGWSVITLRVLQALDQDRASLAPSVIFLGMGIGSSLMGYLASKTNANYRITIFSGLAMISIFLILLFIKLSYKEAILLLFFLGIASAYQIAILSKVPDLVNIKIATTATALTNMIMMSFGSFYHYTIGTVVRSFGGQGFDNPISIRWVCFSIILGLSLGLLLLFILLLLERRNSNRSPSFSN